MKVFPEDESDLGGLLDRVKKVDGCNSAKIIDYVFGAKVIQASFVTEDGSGRDFETEVSQIQGVSNVQVEEVGLVS
jgi:translation elongation factor EF-1beta